ncbi:MAG: site-2 protease family protein [Candidatus Eremiobacteraeota bacterium]|nr:site-2 protease family protein [Candidatus Eremiobacteraeota bacterium]MCW5871744.1 site-2 protease family protein [Candidatus Eremiobacteraeota bacterium]
MSLTPLFLAGAIVGLLIAFVVHEWAHAQAAYSLGDPTSKYDGRLTLNPLVHLDPVGSVCLLVSMITSQGQMCLGWAKPVMFNRDNFKNPWVDGALVALAGPMSNLLTAMFFATLCRFGLPGTEFLYLLVLANVGFGLFNLFPLPPLDGWKIVQAFVPRDAARTMQRWEDSLGRFAPVFLLLCSMAFMGIFIRPAVAYTMYFLLRFPN